MGSVYNAEKCEKRWGRRLVMSEDLKVLETMPDGSAVDITQVLIMANATGFNAAEALNATTMSCSAGGKANLLFSAGILTEVVDGVRFYRCKFCYMEAVKDDPDDHRASRGTAEGGIDTELSGMQYIKDKCDNECRPFKSLKQQMKTALGQLCQ